MSRACAAKRVGRRVLFKEKFPNNIMGLSYVHETSNIKGLSYVLSIMGLSYVQRFPNIMGLSYVQLVCEIRGFSPCSYCTQERPIIIQPLLDYTMVHSCTLINDQ